MSHTVRNRNQKIAAIVSRDGYDCFFCRTKLKVGAMTIEHLVSSFSGGEDCLENLAIACKSCNEKAGSLPLAQKIRMREAALAAPIPPAPLRPMSEAPVNAQLLDALKAMDKPMMGLAVYIDLEATSAAHGELDSIRELWEAAIQAAKEGK